MTVPKLYRAMKNITDNAIPVHLVDAGHANPAQLVPPNYFVTETVLFSGRVALVRFPYRDGPLQVYAIYRRKKHHWSVARGLSFATRVTDPVPQEAVDKFILDCAKFNEGDQNDV